MDEQTIQQPISEPEISSGVDEHSYDTYDAPEPEESLSEPDYPEPDYSDDGSVSSAEGNVTLAPDGELEFSDDFFGDIGADEPPAVPKYTQDELLSTPFEQWDVNRLEGDVRDYVSIVREQMQKRQMQAMIASRSQTPPMYNAPQEYTPKELAEDAQKLACEKLGLDDPDDFDEYEGEHQAALNMAMQELATKRHNEVLQYQRVTRDYQDLQRFNTELISRPDFGDFDRWFTGKLREHGVTPQQVEAGLMRYAQESGGDYRSLQGVLAGWYQEFQQERGRSTGRRTNRPPVLESPRGSSYEGRRSMDMRRFGDLDPDGQAAALMRMGIV